MAFIPAVDTALVFMEYLLPNMNRAGNTYWIRDTTGQPGTPRLEALRDIMVDWEENTAAGFRASQVSLVRVNLRDMTVENGAVVDSQVVPPIPGESASPALPANVTFAVSYRTGLSGRSFRGRQYWVGLSESSVSGDFLITGQSTLIVGALLALRVALSIEDFELSVVSRFANGSPRTSAVVTPVSAILAVDDRVDTQRRRLAGEGS